MTWEEFQRDYERLKKEAEESGEPVVVDLQIQPPKPVDFIPIGFLVPPAPEKPK